MFSPQSQAEQDQLTCHYFNKHPLLFLKPAKIEIANLKPNIYLIHDVIRDTDIEFIKELAMPRVSCELAIIKCWVEKENYSYPYSVKKQQ